MALIIQPHQWEWKTRVVGGFGGERKNEHPLLLSLGRQIQMLGPGWEKIGISRHQRGGAGSEGQENAKRSHICFALGTSLLSGLLSPAKPPSPQSCLEAG